MTPGIPGMCRHASDWSPRGLSVGVSQFRIDRLVSSQKGRTDQGRQRPNPPHLPRTASHPAKPQGAASCRRRPSHPPAHSPPYEHRPTTTSHPAKPRGAASSRRRPPHLPTPSPPYKPRPRTTFYFLLFTRHSAAGGLTTLRRRRPPPPPRGAASSRRRPPRLTVHPADSRSSGPDH
jgi:hypothetical protein